MATVLDNEVWNLEFSHQLPSMLKEVLADFDVQGIVKVAV